MKNSLRISILTRDNYTCQYCGRRAPQVELHVEHIISRYDGGPDHPSNLVAACTDCNYGKGKRSLIIEELLPKPTRSAPSRSASVRKLKIPDQFNEGLTWEQLMVALERAHSEVALADVRGSAQDDMENHILAEHEYHDWFYHNFEITKEAPL